MRVASLSFMLPFNPALPQLHRTVDQQDGLLEQKKASLPRVIILLTKCLPPILLVFAFILTLISLLLPTMTHHEATFFSIRPIGHARKVTAGILPVSSTSPSLSELSMSPLAAIGGIKQELEEMSTENDIVNAAKTIVQSGNVTLEEWLGIDGPSIFVGALRICSRMKANESIMCTSSGEAAYHAAFLPLSLGMALTALPPSPFSPILLSLSGIFTLISALIFIASLISWHLPLLALLRRKFRLGVAPHRPDYPRGTVSVRPLVHEDRADDKEKSVARVKRGNGPHPAFFCTGLSALGVAGGAMVELRDVSKAWGQWDDIQAWEVGLEFRLGTLIYLLPLISVCLSLVLIIGSLPWVSSVAQSKHYMNFGPV
ncbi:hypothetical protein C349_02430 [Cryptococcus neoformans var. grubii Br795]|uniref:Uncharacterized protein n=1 Tax=Cryptococcus neoformans Tu259-1 TaxID=1230072 RepID=A0A854QGA7_CRYNE|nr:hypothetical protein C344_02272 [Cryptococcus neoformans var. grubii AD1-7a]OXG24017.1 hypothetical protein C361_02566 [Cryptococcus neoformans var. grubii Tu259-1]OXG36342.1 hypothetical protein C360_02958 [Cryptococcus neoformans var. grubii Bt15]OXG43344.1 hypothetical protein C359_01745 [Cryptococcus neoformans var. grubii Bt120]OXG85127.1 hypothetical protein C349_02430 [Cryptococcus neoformans var. grubii Br795]OXG89601.1 hypothetical protein C346_02380 [Cryptococcus neoformans var. g